jgi:N-acetylglucosaminyl-diphospho-decaprenol L-rhamnosyltransferase
MDLSIAINNHKNPELLKLCLESIKKNVGNNIRYEIILADSETEESTFIMMREDYPEIKFFPFKNNVGFQALVKKGVEESKAPYILFLNGDIIITKNSVEELFQAIRRDEKIGLIAPKLLNFNGALQYSCLRFYKPQTILYRRTFLGKLGFGHRHLDWFLMKDYGHFKPREVDWVMGSAMMASRRAIRKVGLMDPEFFMYMEDVDWCRRFWENGYKVVYWPLSVMYHYHGRGSARGSFFHSLFLNKLTRIHITSAVKYFLKYRGKKIPTAK